ncbi:ephrin type-A receptor 1 [Trachemys scripta elegans]|uniref:ephrin type-A receptor 1 n=1 Tax=Trachemys scripta elegans TaxID=31138 RepID=UPI001555BE27|nr:ephrin type-A receptor 1 [Trachemys scripta elegans]
MELRSPGSRTSLSTGLFLLLCAFLPSEIPGKEVNLLDTSTAQNELGWLPDPPETGWSEVQQMINSTPIYMYQDCSVLSEGDTDHWLRTNWIYRGEAASRIYVELKFTVRDCKSFKGAVVTCKETFNLYYMESEQDVGIQFRRPLFTKVNTVAADRSFTSRDIESGVMQLNVEVCPIRKLSQRGFYLAFQNSGACVALVSVRVYYKTCPETVVGLAHFPETLAGSEGLTEVPGVCVEDATEEAGFPPRMHCSADGEWLVPMGQCLCAVGFEEADRSCVACQRGFYRHSPETEHCLKCPPNSSSSATGATACPCNPGFYRAPTESQSVACTRPPSSPRNVSFSLVGTQLSLWWQPPSDHGGRKDLTYSISCQRCSVLACEPCEASVVFSPSASGLNNTSIDVNGLEAYTNYSFTVKARNGVSEVSPFPQRTSPAVWVSVGHAAPVTVSHLTLTQRDDSSLSVSWPAPRHRSRSSVQYEVMYFEKGPKLLSGLRRHKLLELQHGVPGVKIVMAQEHLLIGDLELKPPHRVDFASKQVEALSVLRLGCRGQLTVSVLLVHSRNHERAGLRVAGKRCRDLDRYRDMDQHLDLERGQDDEQCQDWHQVQDLLGDGDQQAERRHDGEWRCKPERCRKKARCHQARPDYDISAFDREEKVWLKPYVDLQPYEDPSRGVLEFTKELDVAYVTMENVIGEGEFGEVYRGTLRLPGKERIVVAIKTLKSTYSDSQWWNFLREATIMGQFNHHNIVHLEGVVTKRKPMMIITEYMENGALDMFLRENEEKFSSVQLVVMLQGIASGMTYLSDRNYVHRDLAARNILVTHSLQCKVSDFGLSRILENDVEGTYETKGGKIPIRWTAPEAIAHRIFTSASDVWSYGIVMWEVLSFGDKPYGDMTNQEVMKSIEDGYRLPPPVDCPSILYELMKGCWSHDRMRRPRFQEIQGQLEHFISSPHLLRSVADFDPRVTLRLPSCSGSDGIPYQSIPEWLESIRMKRYIINFRTAGLDTMESILELTTEDLKKMGVSLPGHQKRILCSIQGFKE